MCFFLIYEIFHVYKKVETNITNSLRKEILQMKPLGHSYLTSFPSFIQEVTTNLNLVLTIN